MLKRILFLIAIVCIAGSVMAQVTTSSLTGNIKRAGGEPLGGATVKATHVPSGTTYVTVTGNSGVYNIVNMVPGGPYRIEITFVGFSTVTQDNIILPLGENTRFDTDLSSSTETLTAVVVSTTGGGAARKKTGATTSISTQQLASLPTLSRSLQDFTRLTPQANGNSFGGVSNRFNNITIDGAVNNDVFGLAASGAPGGQAATTPISLDAIQEIQVVLAPYDITFGNFTGGGINAITRSGTNNVEGSVYFLMRNENTVGKDPISRANTADFSDKTYGLRVGGPIIKNKLFFFVNGEMNRRTAPTIFNAGEPGSSISVADAQRIADTMRIKYNYDVGTFGAFDAATESNKIFGRIDWNINDKHRLVVRHNYIDAFDDNISRTNTFFRFGNNTYRFNNKQNITVMELRSRFTNAISNNLIVGLHRIRDFRSTYGTLFPSIEIANGPATYQLGSERSSTANQLDQDIFEITDNVKIFKGKHSITLGTHNEFFKFRNLFINNGNGRWRFGSLNDFYGNFPRQFDVTFSANKAQDSLPAARFKAGSLGFYAQDEIQFNPKFRLTFGVRADVLKVFTEPGYNKAVDSTFNGKYNTAFTPDGQIMWSPRVGFNYDIEGDRKLILRGGVGIFSGRAPFVWLSNQYGGTGLLFRTTARTDNTPTAAPFDVNNGQGFNPNVGQQSTINSSAAASTYEVNIIDKNFKLPQVFRTNLAVDAKLPGGFNLTVEGLYSKTVNNIFYQDVNLAPPVGVVDPAYNNGADTRIAYSSSTGAGGRRINPTITNAILITNTNKGYTYNLGFTLNKQTKNIFAQLSYNNQGATDQNSGASSTALSNWEFVQVVGNPNNPRLANSNYLTRHRITAIFALNFDYAKHFKTGIAFFYSANSGQQFTYLVNGDLNVDGRFGNDLIYVPRNASEITFVDMINSSNVVIYTAAQQAQQFQTYVDNDPYLSTIRGQYTERNRNSTPWEHVIDAKITQDFYVMTGGKRHDLQLTFDVFNLTNLLNRDWGRQYSVGNQAYNLLTTVNRTTGPFIGKGYNFTPGQTPWSLNFASRWQGQIGIRYTFN
jgi:outer membrane receptor protein involved in Fe transport